MVALHVSRPKICNICTNFTKPVTAIRLSSLKGAKTRCLAYHVGNQILHNIRKSYTQIWQIQVILGRFRRGLILIKFVGHCPSAVAVAKAPAHTSCAANFVAFSLDPSMEEEANLASSTRARTLERPPPPPISIGPI